MNLVHTTELLLSRIAQLLQPFDLTPSSALVLSMLANSSEPLSPSEIASRLITSRATVTSLLDSLERRRYVRRRPHPTDRRMLLIEPTKKGRQIAEQFLPIVHSHQREWFEAFDVEEQGLMLDLLQRLQGILSVEPDKAGE
ncbi:MAG TPA: MarR family transcriptional regulator [Anaerolineales bacterium]|nr:MarR family transcriptional regulator [Anaerolineales bacterium]